jgi:hypothetical protein
MYIRVLHTDNEIASGVLHDAVNRLCQVFLLSKCHTVAQYKHKFNFIYDHKKSAAFPLPIFMKLANTRQHYVSVFYIEFNLKWAINVGSMDRYSFTPLSKVWLLLCLLPQNSWLLKVCGHLPYWILSKWDVKYRKYGHNFIYCYSKISFLLYCIVQNSQLFNYIVPNFMQISQEMWEVWVEI